MAGGAAAGAGMLPVNAAAQAEAISGGRSVSDFGVDPSSGADQTEALQKAIDEIAGTGAPVFLPAGTYHANALSLRAGNATIGGVAGATKLHVRHFSVEIGGEPRGSLSVGGLVFEGPSDGAKPQLAVSNAYIRMTNCIFLGGSAEGGAVSLENCFGTINACALLWYPGAGVMARNAPMSISGCDFGQCGTGVAISDSKAASIAQNRFDQCSIGVALTGDGIVSNNVVTGAADYGLRLGSAESSGSILAQGNLIRDCRIGIGVAPAGDDIFATLNAIHGAREGAIRAFDGDNLVGPDLAIESAEAYLNLTLIGNVAR